MLKTCCFFCTEVSSHRFNNRKTVTERQIMLIVTLAVFRDSLWMIVSTWWLFISLPFHYFLYLQLNSCNGTLNAIEKTLSVRWNAFNVEMDQPISHCITQHAIQIHQREIKTESVRKHHRLLPQPTSLLGKSANPLIEHGSRHVIYCVMKTGSVEVTCECWMFIKRSCVQKIKNLKNAPLLSDSCRRSK